ncbi:MAG: N-acetylneuraminate synthase family protein [Patescibacteria group bacterium]
MAKEFNIGKTKIGGSNPCFIVAEVGINFNGEYENALKLIDSAARAGCDAVKFQLFFAKKMYPPSAGNDKSGQGRKKNIYQIVKSAQLPQSWIPKLKKYAESKGLEFFCTVCEEKGADILKKYKMPAFKFASYEITHIPLLRYVARFQKPIIFSCGAAEIKEIAEALEIFKEEKNNRIALLHCIAEYGAPLNRLNLSVIYALKTAFPDIVIGYSDHSADPIIAPRAAVALGAKIIEKHITLDKNMPGPDHFFALEPKELTLMVKTIRRTEKEMKIGRKIKIQNQLLGSPERKAYKNEMIPRSFAQRCVFAIKNIKKGEKFSRENIAVLRPGNHRRGLDPKYYELLVGGYKATKNLQKYRSISWEHVLSK